MPSIGRRATTALLVAAVASGCGVGSGPGASAFPSVTGVWEGDYTYALQDGSATQGTQRITITTQDGALLWGISERDGDASLERADVVGTLLQDGDAIALSEVSSGFFEGSIGEGTMRLVFVRSDERAAAFQAVLTRLP
jgi:hypothetical protein